MKTQTNCPQSELSGFAPTETTVQTWMEKLKSNGITEGCLCRLIQGHDEDKIVKFQNYHVNDLGICIDGGYFLFQDGDTLKVAEPLFVPLLELSGEVKFFGGTINGSKRAYFGNDLNVSYTSVSYSGNTTFGKHDASDLNADKAIFNAEFYEFQTARDLFAWMALND